MKGSAKVITQLNSILTNELTAINQYFLHAKMIKHWGFESLGQVEYKASIDEMKHADELIDRILTLEGVPNLQKIGKVNIGQDISEILKADLAFETNAVKELKDSIEICEQEKDYVSRDLLTRILDSEEAHIDFLETKLELIDKIGLQNFLQSQL